jgi:hypothetical protein
MAQQFGLVTMYPPLSLRQLCCSIIARWSAFTSGTTRGTSGAMRKALEFDTTAQPAAANFGSSSRACSASSAAKMIFGSSPAGTPSGTFGITVIAAMCAGSGVSSFHRQASP